MRQDDVRQYQPNDYKVRKIVLLGLKNVVNEIVIKQYCNRYQNEETDEPQGVVEPISVRRRSCFTVRLHRLIIKQKVR